MLTPFFEMIVQTKNTLAAIIPTDQKAIFLLKRASDPIAHWSQ
jgi:hypothetical protein